MEMQSRNMSDIIEEYLKDILNDVKQVEIKRSEIARQFNCVPSQINYVIKTRFNLKNGYVVRSKRGGGGYIRIVKVDLVENPDLIDDLINAIGMDISENQGYQIIKNLFDDDILSQKEANLLLAATSRDALQVPTVEQENFLRARILVRVLKRLRLEE
ncbi:transcriptional regulator CtsR [Ligilactobacillus hayakitensis DSM 18933 = JCM 14209]|uniref:Transcriptional regulator CtsR n=2 Tax=Ligilactobacillus TaxID=2767887 RepID=A0A0R1WJV3_9LACO|nr:transcriptional regulator CtsR [Ligilactobacillus hayakitensis DSM 18933 = JCM 14209]